MSKLKLEIQDFEDKKSTTGKRYTRFKTDQGWMSCWDKAVCEKLKDQEGKEVFVEITEQGDFKNIQKIINPDEMSKEPDSDEEEETPRSRPVSDYRMLQELHKQAGVAMRFAVDLCVAHEIGLAAIHGEAQNIFKWMKDLAAGQ